MRRIAMLAMLAACKDAPVSAGRDEELSRRVESLAADNDRLTRRTTELADLVEKLSKGLAKEMLFTSEAFGVIPATGMADLPSQSAGQWWCAPPLECKRSKSECTAASKASDACKRRRVAFCGRRCFATLDFCGLMEKPTACVGVE